MRADDSSYSPGLARGVAASNGCRDALGVLFTCRDSDHGIRRDPRKRTPPPTTACYSDRLRFLPGAIAGLYVAFVGSMLPIWTTWYIGGRCATSERSNL